MSSGIEFRKDDETVRRAQAFVDEKCAVEEPPESLAAHGLVVGAHWWDKHASYAILFADGHEHGGFGEKWWGNYALPPVSQDAAPETEEPSPEDVPAEPAATRVRTNPLVPIMSDTEVTPTVDTPPSVEPLPTDVRTSPAPAAPVVEPPVDVESPAVVEPLPTDVRTSPSPPPRAPTVIGVRPRIVTVVPFSSDGDLGRVYNEHMHDLGENDWACFLDHDAVHTTRKWYTILEKAVADHPRVGLFGAVTNRVGSPDQELPGVDRNDHDMVVHRKIGLACAEGEHAPTSDWPEYVDMDVPGKNWLAGVLMLTSKRAWKKAKSLDVKGAEICGFREGYLFGVDNEYHKAQRLAGNKVLLLTRLYVYHWYRANKDEEHVQRLGPTRSFRE